MTSPRKKKLKIGAPSHTHKRGCLYCDEKVLVKNYPRHLEISHPEQNKKDLKDKSDREIKSFFAPISSSRKRPAIESEPVKVKIRKSSGDSALGLSEDDELSPVVCQDESQYCGSPEKHQECSQQPQQGEKPKKKEDNASGASSEDGPISPTAKAGID